MVEGDIREGVIVHCEAMADAWASASESNREHLMFELFELISMMRHAATHDPDCDMDLDCSCR